MLFTQRLWGFFPHSKWKFLSNILVSLWTRSSLKGKGGGLLLVGFFTLFNADERNRSRLVEFFVNNQNQSNFSAQFSYMHFFRLPNRWKFSGANDTLIFTRSILTKFYWMVPLGILFILKGLVHLFPMLEKIKVLEQVKFLDWTGHIIRKTLILTFLGTFWNPFGQTWTWLARWDW